MPNNSCSRLSTLARNKTDSKQRGTGSTIELTWQSDRRITSISCHASLMAQLNLPSEAVDKSDYFEGATGNNRKTGTKTTPRKDVLTVINRGDSYVTVHIPQKVMSRHEIRDSIYGHGWRLAWSSLCNQGGQTVHEELWSRDVKGH